jgi:hypothetical protein
MLMILKRLEDVGRSVCRQVSSVRVAKFTHRVAAVAVAVEGRI